MKKLYVLLIALSLSGCMTAGELAQNLGIVNQSLSNKVAAVQAYAVQVCRYAPTVATVISIFNTGLGDVISVANSICNAVTNRPLADGPGNRIPRVNGVVVRGRYV